MLNPHSPLPLYHQLAEQLGDQIRAGDFPAGSKIPSEHALCARYGVGRPTVRQATELLVRRRLLERRRGAGTFVLEPPAKVDLLSLGGTLRGFRDSGVKADSQWLGAARRVQVPAGEDEHPLAGGQAIELRRLSRVRGEPVLLEELHLHPELFAPLLQLRLEGRSLSEVVQQQLGLSPLRAQQRLQVVALDAPRAGELELEPGTAVLRVQRRIDFAGADGAIHGELFCHTDRLALSQTIEATSDA